MTQAQFQAALYAACLSAIRTLGPEVKQMSCFVENWGHQMVVDTEKTEVREAAHI